MDRLPTVECAPAQALRDNLSSSSQVSVTRQPSCSAGSESSGWGGPAAAEPAAEMISQQRRAGVRAAALVLVHVRIRALDRQAGLDPGVEPAGERADARETGLPELVGHPGRRGFVRSRAVEDDVAPARQLPEALLDLVVGQPQRPGMRRASSQTAPRVRTSTTRGGSGKPSGRSARRPRCAPSATRAGSAGAARTASRRKRRARRRAPPGRATPCRPAPPARGPRRDGTARRRRSRSPPRSPRPARRTAGSASAAPPGCRPGSAPSSSSPARTCRTAASSSPSRS